MGRPARPARDRPEYSHFTAEQVQNAVPLATSPGYYDNGGVTHYYMFPTQDLPLLNPVRGLPLVGKPLADLLQPDLTVLVNLGSSASPARCERHCPPDDRCSSPHGCASINGVDTR